MIAALAIAFVAAQVDIATKSIQFDLRKIGESVYEAHSKSGKWPAQIHGVQDSFCCSLDDLDLEIRFGLALPKNARI